MGLGQERVNLRRQLEKTHSNIIINFPGHTVYLCIHIHLTGTQLVQIKYCTYAQCQSYWIWIIETFSLECEMQFAFALVLHCYAKQEILA